MHVIRRFIGLAHMALLALPLAAGAVVTVPGTSDMWLAGMPDGSTASSGDTAPTHSPVLYTGLTLTAGDALTFAVAINAAAGPVGNCPGCTSPTPDGGGVTGHSAGAQNGISNVIAPVNALMGVFLSDALPSLSAAPGALDFGVGGLGLNFLSVAPELKQVFFIGNGLTSGAVAQQFVVPTGATRLYLGTMDGFGWFNNVGAYDVTASPVTPPIPEPGTYALMLAGLGAVMFVARRRRR